MEISPESRSIFNLVRSCSRRVFGSAIGSGVAGYLDSVAFAAPALVIGTLAAVIREVKADHVETTRFQQPGDAAQVAIECGIDALLDEAIAGGAISSSS